MNSTLTDFINLAIDRCYRGKTIADSMGNPFVVRYLVGGSDDGAYEVTFYERLPIESGRLEISPYPWAPRSRNVRESYSMPDILNLRYDETIKAWVPYPVSPLS